MRQQNISRKASLKRYVEGWVNYFKLADMGNLLKSTDEWMNQSLCATTLV
ncbi:MAG: group II intron maturase-specific domain-containing protein [Faecousia sp.]